MGKSFLECPTCYHWEWADLSGVLDAEHHPNCPKHDKNVIRRLTDAMKEWGSWEDGIHEDHWSAYCDGLDAIGEPIPADASASHARGEGKTE